MTDYEILLNLISYFYFFIGEDVVGSKGMQGEQGRDDIDGPPGLRGEPGNFKSPNSI